ncbi:MAG: MBL fold metallo-hydrolase [Anaerolineales bacterium]|nr:MBL fold metallo-hydrolase [Anaerolineae bacterium]MCB9143505.1 MBL fold metallo-hydrolase [Anaerolineales bacterium]
MEIAPGIYSMSQRQGAYVHAFLLDDGNGLTLIDTLYDTDAHRILAELQRIGKTPQDIKHIIMTHCHRSHLGGLARLKELSGAPIYAHEWEADLIAGERKQQPVSWLPHQPARVWPLQIALNLGVAKHPPATVDNYIHEGDQVGPLRIVACPGHSPGHLSFWWEEQRLLIAGDAICTWPTLLLGWRGFTLNLRQHKESVRRLAEFDSEILCVGHGDPLPAGAAQQIRAALPTLDK